MSDSLEVRAAAAKAHKELEEERDWKAALAKNAPQAAASLRAAQNRAAEIKDTSSVANQTYDDQRDASRQWMDNASAKLGEVRGTAFGRVGAAAEGIADSRVGRDTSDFLGEVGRQMQDSEIRNRKHANWDTLQQRQQRQKERAEEMRSEADRAGAIAARDEKAVAGERTEALAKSAGNLAADSLGGTAGAGAAGIARMQAAQKARDQGGAQQLSEATQRKDKYENEEVTRRGEANAQQQKAEETAMANQNEQEQQNMENTIERAQMREEWDAQDKLRDEERAARDAHSDENLKEVGPHTGHIGDPEEEEEISEREINRALMRGIR